MAERKEPVGDSVRAVSIANIVEIGGNGAVQQLQTMKRPDPPYPVDVSRRPPKARMLLSPISASQRARATAAATAATATEKNFVVSGQNLARKAALPPLDMATSHGGEHSSTANGASKLDNTEPGPRNFSKSTSVEAKMLKLLRSIWASQESIAATTAKVVQLSYKLVDAERITLFLVDNAMKEIIIAESKDAKGVRIPIDKGIVGHVVSTQKPLCIDDAYSDSRFDPSVDTKTGYRTRNLLCVPIIDDEGNTVAAVQAINRRGKESFTKKDVEILKMMSASVGIAIKKATLHRKLVREKRTVEALYDLMKASHAEHGFMCYCRFGNPSPNFSQACSSTWTRSEATMSSTKRQLQAGKKKTRRHDLHFPPSIFRLFRI